MRYKTTHRHLHCRCCCHRHCRETTAFPSRIPPPANDVGQQRAGGEPMRHYAVPLPSPPKNCKDVPIPSSFSVSPLTATAVVGGHHRSLVIVPLSQTVAVIFLVLLLPHTRTPIPNCETHPRRATYDNNGGPALIHARG